MGYDNTLLSVTIRRNLEKQITRVNLDYGSAIIIDGIIGKGKTMTAVTCANYILEKLNMPELDFEKQLARGGEEFLKKLDICIKDKLPVLVYDEAGDFSKKTTLTKFNLAIGRIVEQYRQFHIIIIIVLPLFHYLDNSLLDNGVPRILIHLRKRYNGYIVVWCYSLHRMFFLKKHMSKLADKNFAFTICEPNFDARVKAPSKEMIEKLKRFSLAGKKEQVRKAQIIYSGLLSYMDIANKLNRSIIWVKKTVRELKIKPDRLIGKKLYFKDDALERLGDYLDEKNYKRGLS